MRRHLASVFAETDGWSGALSPTLQNFGDARTRELLLDRVSHGNRQAAVRRLT